MAPYAPPHTSDFSDVLGCSYWCSDVNEDAEDCSLGMHREYCMGCHAADMKLLAGDSLTSAVLRSILRDVMPTCNCSPHSFLVHFCLLCFAALCLPSPNPVLLTHWQE